MDLNELREEIDKINNDIVNLYVKRLDIVKKIGIYKIQNSIKVFDKSREDKIINEVTKNVSDDKKEYVINLFHFIMDESKKYQNG